MRLLQPVAALLCLEAGAAFLTLGSALRSPLELLSQPTNDDEWSIADNWEKLSHENPNNGVPDSRELFNQDFFQRQANAMEIDTEPVSLSKEEQWLRSTIDHIIIDEDMADDEAPSPLQEGFEDKMGDEIAMLVRCNERPQDLLIQEGRAVAPLTKEERFDPAQLVAYNEGGDWQATPFLQEAVAQIFEEYCTEDKVLDASAVAAWMQQSLGDEVVGPYDRRVTSIISLHGTYRKGYLTLENFQSLYLQTLVGSSRSHKKSEASAWRYLKGRSSAIRGVWRDLRNHAIIPPNEKERAKLLAKIQEELDHHQHGGDVANMLMDECEIIYDGEVISDTTDREGTSSFEKVELAPDQKTPLWMGDGEFVFIDEESCIGCMQCTAAAPSSFRMVENGRARTFVQKKTPEVAVAVNTCPVTCMHYVGYRELKELETARDHGDGRDDHRHFGSSPTRGYIGRIPLHVSGIDSDANHRSSWYHYLKSKCQSSHECPQRGCYDCPQYSNPAENPFLQKRLREANHVRAQYFMKQGLADPFRKSADL